MVTEIEHPKKGTIRLPGGPIKLADSPVEVTAAPLLGEHSAEVYRVLVGYGGSHLARLKDEQAF